MRLLELHIDGFGKFHDRTISFNDGINIIYGKNEAGKSTLHTFIRGMLFGIERGRGRAALSGAGRLDRHFRQQSGQRAAAF